MSKIKILECHHKKVEIIPHDDIYLPIHVGRAVSDEKLDMIGDDTGDNISEKNPYYSELTGLYWAWKNLKDVDYVGLCHYRRHFDLSGVSIEKTLRKYDIILLKPNRVITENMSIIVYLTTREDTYLLINVICTHFPNYKKALTDYLFNSNKWIPYNMFVTSRHHFENYTKWLFDVLSIFESQLRLSEYSRLRRVVGYMGEILLPIYCVSNGFKIKHVDLCEKKRNNIKHVIYNLIACVCFKMSHPFKTKQISIPGDVMVGFNKDNIELCQELKENVMK